MTCKERLEVLGLLSLEKTRLRGIWYVFKYVQQVIEVILIPLCPQVRRRGKRRQTNFLAVSPGIGFCAWLPGVGHLERLENCHCWKFSRKY